MNWGIVSVAMSPGMGLLFLLFLFHGAIAHQGPLEHARANLKGRVHLIASCAYSVSVFLIFLTISRKLRERVLLKNSCSIDHQHDKTIADHQPLTTANDKTIADHQPLTTANDKNDKTIADRQPLTTANDKTMRRSAEKIC